MIYLSGSWKKLIFGEKKCIYYHTLFLNHMTQCGPLILSFQLPSWDKQKRKVNLRGINSIRIWRATRLEKRRGVWRERTYAQIIRNIWAIRGHEFLEWSWHVIQGTVQKHLLAQKSNGHVVWEGNHCTHFHTIGMSFNASHMIINEQFYFCRSGH